jgi:EamA-like transporter family.
MYQYDFVFRKHCLFFKNELEQPAYAYHQRWSTLLGGIFLLPALFFTYHSNRNLFDVKWISCVLWLAVMVSIFAIQLWLYLLRRNPVKASFWLFLCPVFGFIIAAIMLKEPISLYTFAGVALVIGGLYLVQNKRVTS